MLFRSLLSLPDCSDLIEVDSTDYVPCQVKSLGFRPPTSNAPNALQPKAFVSCRKQRIHSLSGSKSQLVVLLLDKAVQYTW